MKTILMIYPKDRDGRDNIFDEIRHEIIKRSQYTLEIVNTVQDILHRLEMNSRICGILYDWDSLGMKVPHAVTKINENLPIFAFSLTHTVKDLNIADLLLHLYFLDYKSYSAVGSVDRIDKAIKIYYNKIMPPFTKTLFEYTKENKYRYCTPGHLGGSAYLASPVGSIFYDFYGENIFKADISVSMPELGSLLDHSGPHKEAEVYIAKTFNADRSYMVLGGTSAANKIVGMGIFHSGATVLIDRNCHKSITHLLMMTDVRPIYLKPTRNRYGIIGGIPKSEFAKKTIKNKILKANKTAKKHKLKDKFTWPLYSVITNSTYDGLLYNAEYIKKNLAIKHIHFDSAWVPYTNFSPIYKNLYGMHGKAPKNKVIYETQSTHKTLAAFSQTSMVHIKGKYNEDGMDESFMMHSSTSPQYAMVASAEIGAAMMKGNAGKRLMEVSQRRAMNFRQEIKKLNKQNKKGWFFDVWQPKKIENKAQCWPLTTKDNWHGFGKVDSNFLFLDPIKITVLMPGLKNNKLTDFGIPASLVAKYLDYKGIVVEKTGPYSILFLFTIGIDKAKSLKLLSTFMEFKREFDANLTVEEMIPNLYKEDPVFYKKMKVQTLAKSIHDIYKKFKLPHVLDKAYNILPEQCMTPYEAYQERIQGRIEKCNLKDIKNKVCAEMILPYPPGIPLILPGEMITDDSINILDYLLTIGDIGKCFRNFAQDIHGAWQEDDGEYYTHVLK